MLKGFLFLTLLLAFELKGFAAPRKEAARQQAIEFISKGAFKGGKAGNGFTLLNVKRVLSPSKQAERFIVEMGDKNGRPYNGKPGYFHVQLHQNPNKLTIDFEQVNSNKITSKRLSELFKGSVLVASSKIRVDADEKSTNFTLHFKKKVKARVYTLSPKGTSPKVVIDFIHAK